jgi:hypothetical protein
MAPGCGERHQEPGVGLGVAALHGWGRGEKGEAASRSRPRPRRQSRSDDIAWRERGASAGRPMVTRTRVGVRCTVEVGALDHRVSAMACGWVYAAPIT